MKDMHKSSYELIQRIRKNQRRRDNKKAVIRMVLLSALITALLITGVYAMDTDHVPQDFHTIEVEYGDSLWSIAKEYCKDKDVRKSINTIKKLNNMKSSTIYEGDVLKVPIQ